MTRGGAWACPLSVRMLVNRRPLRSEYTNSRSVSFTVTLRDGSSKATDGSGLDFTTHRHCTVSRAAAQCDSRRIMGATARSRPRQCRLKPAGGQAARDSLAGHRVRIVKMGVVTLCRIPSSPDFLSVLMQKRREP